ncbi:MAG: hypothetical protein ACX930_00260 [Erythrobacter sp.]
MISAIARGFTCALALSAALVAIPAEAHPTDGWFAKSDEDHCDLRFYRDGMMVMMIRNRGQGSYSLSGEAFRMPESDRDVTGAMRVVAGGDVVLLNGSMEEMQEQAMRTREHPLALFFAVMADKQAFTLDTEREEQEIPLAGFDPVASEFNNCSQRLYLASGPHAPRLIDFDGLQQLGAEASRQRLLSEKIGYTFTVDAQGKATDCKLSRDFRRRAVTIALCRPFLEHATFEPARDAQGNPVEGTFFIEVDFDMWMTQRGYLEPEDR